MGSLIALIASIATIATAAGGLTVYLVRHVRSPKPLANALNQLPGTPSSTLVGRQAELKELSSVVNLESTRMVVLVGAGGLGKTVLAATFCRQQLNGKDSILHWRPWRSKSAARFSSIRWAAVRLRPKADELVADLTLSLADHHVNLANTLEGRLDQLLQLLSDKRCLLVIDNVEAVLDSSRPLDRAVRTEFLYIFRRLAEANHMSVVILTSRLSLMREALIPSSGASLVEIPLTQLSHADAEQLLVRSIPEGKNELAIRQAMAGLSADLPGNPLLIELLALHISGSSSDVVDFDAIIHAPSADIFREVVDWNLQRMTRLTRGVAFQIALFAKGADSVAVTSLLTPRPASARVDSSIEELVFSLGLQRMQNGMMQFHQVVSELLIDALIGRCAAEIRSQEFNLLAHVRVGSSIGCDADHQACDRLFIVPLLERLDVEVNRPTFDLLISGLAIVKGAADRSYPRLNVASNLVTLLMQRAGRLVDVDLSYLLFRYVDFSVAELHNCNFSGSEFEQCIFTLPHGAVLDVAWSKADKSVVGVDALGNALAWTGEGYRELTFERVSGSWLRALITIKSDRLVAGGDDNELILLRAGDLKVLDRKRLPEMYWIRTLTAEPDGSVVCSGGEDGSVRLWDVSDDRLHLKATWPLRRGTVRSVRMLAEGRIAAACDQGSVAIIDASRSGVRYFELGETQVRCLDVERRRGLIAAYADDAGLWILDTCSGNTATKPPTSSGSIRTLAWCADGRSVVASGDDGVVWRWPVSEGEPIVIRDPSVVASLPGRVVALKVARSGANIVLSCEGETTYFADLNEERVLPLSRGDARRIWTVSGSPDGQYVVSGGEDRLARVWRRTGTAGSLQEVGALRHGGRVWRARYSADGRYICTASDDNVVRVWSAADLTLLRAWAGHRDWVLDVVPYSDGDKQYVLSAGNDQRVGLWSFDEGLITWFHHHDSRVLRLTMLSSEDIVSSSSDESLAIFDPLTGRVKSRGTLHGHKAWGLDSSPSTGELATGGDDGRVCIWPVKEDGLTPQVIGSINGSILEVRFCRSGSVLVAAGLDSPGLSVFERLDDGEWLSVRVSKTHHRMRALWEADGGILTAGGSDEVLSEFDLSSFDHLGETRIPSVYQSSRFSQSTGLRGTQRSALDALGAFDAEL